MIPRIKKIEVKDNLMLLVTFDSEEQVLYDVKDDVETLVDFRPLQTETGLFENYQLDLSRTCVYWSDRIDLPSDIILEYGKKVRVLDMKNDTKTTIQEPMYSAYSQ